MNNIWTTFEGPSACGKLSPFFLRLQLEHSPLTCNHLPPALIQVRGNHVPHGYRSTSQILQISAQLVFGINSSGLRWNASLAPPRDARLRRCCEPTRSRVGGPRRGDNSPPVRGGRRWTLACFTVAGHTLWESSLVQRVQSALPRVWPEPEINGLTAYFFAVCECHLRAAPLFSDKFLSYEYDTWVLLLKPKINWMLSQVLQR